MDLFMEPWSGVGGTTAIFGTTFGANGSTFTKLVVGLMAAKPINIKDPHSLSSSDIGPIKHNIYMSGVQYTLLATNYTCIVLF